MAAEFPLPIPNDPSIAIGFIWDLLSFVTPIPSPLDLILSLFGGRPTMQATYDVANGLITQPSPALVLCGIGAAFDLQHGIPLSTGNPNPVFGNYFEQAVYIESLTRFSSADPGSMSLSATTLKNCLYEAGNPGLTSNPTILAVNQAWTSLTPAQQANIRSTVVAQPAPPPDASRHPTTSIVTWEQLTALGQVSTPGNSFWLIQSTVNQASVTGQGDVATLDTTQLPDGLANVWLFDLTNSGGLYSPGLQALQYYQVFISNQNPPPSVPIPIPTPPPTTPPPGTPPPTPTPPPGSAPQNIQLEVASGQVVIGTAILGACVTGGPNPNAHIGWQIDGAHAAGPTPAPTYDGFTTQCYNQDWDSTTVSDGPHTLTANWWTQGGILIATVSTGINVQNGTPTPPPTTPPPGTPPTPSPLPGPGCSHFTSPRPNSKVSGTITISVDAVPTDAAYVNFYITGLKGQYIASGPPLSITFDTTQVANGQHTLTVEAFTGGGVSVCKNQILIIVQNGTPPPPPPQPPPPQTGCVSWQTPTPGATLTGTVPVALNSYRSDAAYGNFYITGLYGQYFGTFPPLSATLDTTKVANGPQTISVTVYAVGGAVLCTDSIQVIISNQGTPPPPPPQPPPGPCTIAQALSNLSGSPSAIPGANTDPSTFGQYNAPNGALGIIPMIGGPLLDNQAAAAKVVPTNQSTTEAGPNSAAIQAANNYYIAVANKDPSTYLAALNAIDNAPNLGAFAPYLRRVDGAIPIQNPTVAEIIQWAAAKWGINPALGYAVAWDQSFFDQTAQGDDLTSAGIFQVADENNSLHPQHAFPWFVGVSPRITLLSTPYNADFFLGLIYASFNGAFGPPYTGNLMNVLQSYASGSNLTNLGWADRIVGEISNSSWLQIFPAGLYAPPGSRTLSICQPPPPQTPPPPPPTTPPPPPPPPTTPPPPQPPPSTTCTDPCQQAIDADIQAINKSLQALTTALQSLPQPPAPVINVTPPAGTAPTVNVPPPDLTALSSALSTIAGCVCPALEDIAKAISTAAANPAPPPTIDLSALIAAIKEVYSNTPANQQIINDAATLGTIDPAVAQSASSSFSVHWDPGRFHPKIAKWLADSGFLGTPASDDLAGALARLFTSIFEWFKGAAFSVWPDLANAASGLASGVANNFGTIFNGASALETDLPKLIFEWTLQNALSPGSVTADNVEDDAFKLLGGAFLVGQGVHLLAELAGYLKYPASSVWAHNAEMLIELLGYKEILRSFHGAFFPVAIRERARQRYNKLYAPYIANSNTAYEGLARGKITQAQRDALLNLNGRDVNYIDQEQAIRYRPISPFMLARGFRNRAPSPDLLNQVITDQGITPAFHDTLEQIIIDSCYQNLEQGLENKVLAAAGKGVITLDAAIAQIQALGWDDKAVNLVKQAALFDQQSFIVEEVRREVIDGIKSGGMTAAQGSSLLQATGAAQWLIDHTISLANAEAAMRAAEKIESEELRTQHKTLNDTMAALEAQYLSGNLSLAGFTAAAEVAWFVLSTAYAGLGASAAQVQQLEALQQLSIAATVTRMQALQTGRVVNLFGLQKDRADAQLLTAQVNSIKEMYLRADTTLLATQSALQNLGISKDWVTALTTRWDAQLQKKGALAS